jgi:hypothetical protein
MAYSTGASRGIVAERCVAFALCFSVAASLVYFPITKYDLLDPAGGGREGDVAQYIRMSQGAPITTIPKPYRYRLLTPYLTRLVPFLPRCVTQFYNIDPDKIIKFKFGVVNLLGLACAAYVLFLLSRALAFSALEALLGSLLFLTSFPVVNFAGMPLVDAWAYFFLVLAFLFLLQRRYWLLSIAVLVGMMEKETTALIVLYCLLMPRPWRERGTAILACLPGLLAYGVFRFVLFPTCVGYGYGVLSDPIRLLRCFIPCRQWIFITLDGGMTFAVVWFLGVYGWWRARQAGDRMLFRLGFAVPLIMLAPFASGRIWFLAFPVMIPLALTGLHPIIANARDRSVRGPESA